MDLLSYELGKKAGGGGGSFQIQNGKLVKRKATSTTVPAGTFIKTNVNYDRDDVRTLNGEEISSSAFDRYTYHYTTNLTHLKDNIYCYEGGALDGGKLYTIQLTQNGFVKYAEPFSMGKARIDNRLIKKLDDNTILFMHSAQTFAPMAKICKLTGTTWEEVVEDFYIYPNGGSMNADIYVTQDNSFWYLHVNDNQYISYTKMWKIDKSDYTMTYGDALGVSIGNSGDIFSKTLIDTNKFLYVHNNNNYAVVEFDTSNLSYSQVGSYKNFGSNMDSTLYAYINGKHVLVGQKTTNEGTHTVVQTFTLDGSNDRTITEEADLGVSKEEYNTKYAYFRLDKISNTALLYVYQTSKSNIYARIINIGNTITYGDEFLMETLPDVPSNWYEFYINNAFNLSLPLTNNEFLFLCGYHIGIYLIDDQLNINQSSGNAFTIAEAIDTIEGITTTECTTTTAGNVYILDK